MAKAETVRGLVIAKSVKANVHVCDGCLVGKAHKGPLNPSSDKREVSDVEKGKQAKDVLTLHLQTFGDQPGCVPVGRFTSIGFC